MSFSHVRGKADQSGGLPVHYVLGPAPSAGFSPFPGLPRFNANDASPGGVALARCRYNLDLVLADCLHLETRVWAGCIESAPARSSPPRRRDDRDCSVEGGSLACISRPDHSRVQVFERPVFERNDAL